MQALLKNYPEGVPMLDPITDMKITDRNLPDIIAKAEALEEQLDADPVHIVWLAMLCLCSCFAWHIQV